MDKLQLLEISLMHDGSIESSIKRIHSNGTATIEYVKGYIVNPCERYRIGKQLVDKLRG